MKFRIRKVERNDTISFFPQVKKNAFSHWQNLTFQTWEDSLIMKGKVKIASDTELSFPFQSLEDAKSVVSLFQNQQTKYKETFIYL